jgi:hypothetical protein
MKGRKTGGRQKGTPNKATDEARKAAAAIIEDPDYVKNLLSRARRGKLAPAVECLLYTYRYGKPKETVAVEGPDGAPLAFTLNLHASDRDV